MEDEYVTADAFEAAYEESKREEVSEAEQKIFEVQKKLDAERIAIEAEYTGKFEEFRA